jgi:hypothetical protein
MLFSNFNFKLKKSYLSYSFSNHFFSKTFLFKIKKINKKKDLLSTSSIFLVY